MGMTIVWSDQARSDLRDLHRWIADDRAAPQTAARYLTRLIEAVGRLGRFPELGRPLAEAPPYRRFLFGTYAIVYAIRSDRIEVVAVYHQKRFRDPERLPTT